MIHLSTQLARINRLLDKHKTVILFLDFDGTLSPIAKTWELANLPLQTRNILEKLKHAPEIHIVVISGRSLVDIKRKINIPGLIYAANHGLEWEINGKKESTSIPSDIKDTMKTAKQLMKKLGNEFTGTLIEDKGLTFSVHYRLVDDKKVEKFHIAFRQILNKMPDKKISVIKGKKVYNIRPNINFTKGDFCKILIGRIKKTIRGKLTVFYIGDDATDEEAFMKLRIASTIKVGYDEHSKARYFLRDEKEVVDFLKWLYSVICQDSS